MVSSSMILFTLSSTFCFIFIQFTYSLKLSTENNGCSETLKNVLQSCVDIFGHNEFVHFVFSEGNTKLCLSTEVTKWQVVVSQLDSLAEVKDVLTDHPRVYILMINQYFNLQQLEEAINKLSSFTRSWNTNARFLLITSINLSYTRKIRDQLVTSSFNLLWKRNIFRLAMMVSENDNVTLFSSQPYSPQYNTCKKITDTLQLQETDLLENNVKDINITGYHFKNPKNFLGCPVAAYTYPFPPYSVAGEQEIGSLSDLVYERGIEIEIVHLLAKVYNISLHLKTSKLRNANAWRYQLPNGSFSGMFYDVMNYNIDLSFAGGIPQTDNYFIDLVFTQMTNSISWYVPDGEPLPSWRLILGTFTLPSWLLLLVACTGFFLWYRIVSCLTKETPAEPVGLLVIRILLGMPTYWTPRPYHLRILVLTWNMFSLNLTIMFNTRLFSVLTNPPVSLGVRSLEDLQKSGMKTCTTHTFRRNYINRTNSLVRTLLENWTDCGNMTSALEYFLTNRNFTILEKDDHATFLFDISKSRIHKLEEKFMTYPVTMMLQRGSLLTKPLTSVILRTFSGGLFDKWLLDVRHHVKVSSSLKENKTTGATDSVQNEDFIWLYMLYLSGIFVSFVTFMFEIKHILVTKNVMSSKVVQFTK